MSMEHGEFTPPKISDACKLALNGLLEYFREELNQEMNAEAAVAPNFADNIDMLVEANARASELAGKWIMFNRFSEALSIDRTT